MAAEIIPFAGGNALAITFPDLRDALEDLENPVGHYAGVGKKDPGLVIHRRFAPSSAAIEAARRMLSQMEAALRPATAQAIDGWLQKFDSGLKKPPGEATWKDRRQAFHIAGASLPAAAWTQDSLTAALQNPHFVYLPSASELHAFLADYVRPLVDRVHNLRRIATYQPPKPPERAPLPEVDPKERAAVLRRAQETKAVLLASESQKRRVGVASLPDVTPPPSALAARLRVELSRSDLSDDQRAALQTRLRSLAP